MRNKANKLVLVSLVILACCPMLIAQNAQKDRMNDFLGFLKNVDAAQLELQNGRAEAFKALWSRSDDITLSGHYAWKELMSFVDQEGGLSGSAFRSVYLLNISTNELQRAA